MTINELIDKLEEAKKSLGGDAQVVHEDTDGLYKIAYIKIGESYVELLEGSILLDPWGDDPDTGLKTCHSDIARPADVPYDKYYALRVENEKLRNAVVKLSLEKYGDSRKED